MGGKGLELLGCGEFVRGLVTGLGQGCTAGFGASCVGGRGGGRFDGRCECGAEARQ